MANTVNSADPDETPHCVAVFFVCLSYWFTSQSTAMVILGWSVHLPTLSLGKLEQAVKRYVLHILSLFSFLNHSAERRRKITEIISWSISMKVWDQTGTRDPWICRHTSICSQTHYRLLYAARLCSVSSGPMLFHSCRLSLFNWAFDDFRNLGVLGGIFCHFYSNFNRTFCE